MCAKGKIEFKKLAYKKYMVEEENAFNLFIQVQSLYMQIWNKISNKHKALVYVRIVEI